MRTQNKTPMICLFAFFAWCAVVFPVGRVLAGDMRGTFVRLTELRVQERGYMGLIVKPQERAEPQTLVVPRQPERLTGLARRLREGQIVEIVYVEEAGHKWVQGLEFEGQRTPDRPKGARDTEALWARIERVQRQIESLRAQVARLSDQRDRPQTPERQVQRTVRRERDTDQAGPQRARARAQRDAALRELEVIRMALHGAREAERRDVMERLTLAIRSREMRLEGRRDEEARGVYERAPNPAQLAELLTLTSRLWREFGNADKSEAIGRLARQMAPARREEGRREARTARVRTQSASPEEQIEKLIQAEKVLRDLGRVDQALAINRVIQDLKRRQARR